MLRWVILWIVGLCGPVVSGSLCNGRCAVAEEMLDSAYGRFGTLYTGGPPERYNDVDAGPVIDLWRLWNGLPDLRFRDAKGFDYRGDWGRDYRDFGQTAEDLNLILRIAARPQAKRLRPAFRYVTARYLNTLISAGSGPGWWLAPRPEDMTDRQKLVMAAARPGSLMEWLLVVMGASDTPGAVSWADDHDRFGGATWDGEKRDSYSHTSAMTLMVDLVRQRIEELDWQVARAVTLHQGMDLMQGKVNECSATGAEYAAFAVGVYAQ